MRINITHLYPELLNLYGDSGNIESLRHRLMWRGIEVNITEHNLSDGEPDFSDTDIIVLGGGSPSEEETVISKLIEFKDKLTDYVNSDGVILALCGGMQMLGKYRKHNDKTDNCVGILDIYTEDAKTPFVGDAIIDSSLFDGKIVGFENHLGKVYIGDLKPIGKVVEGSGNNGEDFTEGVIYKNVIGTQLHGPVLPKNPKLCDYVLNVALKRKYTEFSGLETLSDEIENLANDFMVQRCSV